MNFYNEDEDKKGAPVIPGTASPFKKTSAFGKTPMFSRATGSIIDRLKNLSRKDMALVGIGLSVLVMAPVAEYMMSQPAQDNLLKETFNPRSGPGGVMDPGINGLSTGSPDGSGEVITPLSSRDPMSLILGAQPAAAVMPPPSAPPTTSYRDAMKESGRAAFTEASKSAGAPTVIPRIQSALRGIASFGGDSGGSRTSGTLGGGKIIDDARSASSKAKSRSMVGPVAMAGYKGVASTPNSSSKGAFEKLRAQADKSAGNFSGGSAMNSLDKAAADAVNISGSGGLGAGGESEKIKGGSGSTTKYDHNRSGESLAEAAAKARQQKALEWEFFKKYEFKKQLLTAVFGAISTTVGKFVGDTVGNILDPQSAPPKCWNPAVCPDGSSCGELAKQYLGENWWLPPASRKLSDLCSVGGSPVVYSIKAGKESGTTVTEVCICGKGAAPTSGGTPAPANNKPDPADSTAASHSAAVSTNLGDYDTILKDIVTLVAETEAKPEKAEENAKGVLGGFENLKAKANGSVYNVLRNASNEADQELSGYSGKIEASQGKLNTTKGKYDKFVAQLAVLQKDIDNNTVKVKIAEGKERVLDTATVVKIKEALVQWKDTGPVYFNSATSNLEGQRKWQAAFSRQMVAVGRGINEIKNTQNTIDSAVSTIKNSSDSGLDKLKKMSGRLQDIQPSTAAKNSEPTGPAGEPPLKKTASDLRALDWDALWTPEHKFDSTKASEAEFSSWGTWQNTVSKGETVVETVPTSFLANQMRSREVTQGIKGMLPNFPQIDSDLAKTESAMSVVKQAILGYGASDSYFSGSGSNTPGGEVTPGGNTPGGNTPPVVVEDPALAGRKTALLANSRLAASDYEAATAVHKKLGTSNNAQYARSDYKKMTDTHSNIVRLTSELSAPDAKPTKAKLDELELYQTNFNKAYADFQRHAVASGAPVVLKPQPQVIINNNNNVSATAGSNSSAVVRPITNNSTVNNTTVNNNKPPVVVQPVIQPAKPVEPSPNLRLHMPDNKNMTVNRTQFYPNTGSAIYTGSYRESGSYLGIVAKTAYNYQVTCSRSGTSYKISKVEAAPVAFPAGEKSGWLMELLIKKFLRISDIQFGRLYDVSGQRSDLIGKTCHQ